WVPGDSATATLYLKTETCTAATGNATVTFNNTSGTGSEFANSLVFTESLDGGASTNAGSNFTIPGNTVHQLVVTATFPYGDAATQSTNVTMDEIASALAVLVTLSCTDENETDTTATPDTNEPTTPGEWLPPTGDNVGSFTDDSGTGSIQPQVPRLSTGVNGNTLSYTGSGFPPGDSVTITVPDGNGGTVVCPPDPQTVSSDGTISGTCDITNLAPGTYTLTATDTTANTNTSAPFVKSDVAEDPASKPTITITPDGDGNLNVNVSNFPPDTDVIVTGPGGDQITIHTDSTGQGSGTLTIPPDLPPGDYKVTATEDGQDNPSVITIVTVPDDPSNPYKPSQPEIDVTQTVPGGGDAIVGGGGFPPGSQITIDVVDGDGNVVGSETVTVGPDGKIPNTNVPVPDDPAACQPKGCQVVITDPDGNTSTTPITVVDPDSGIPTDDTPTKSPTITVPTGPDDNGNITVGGSNLPPGGTVTITDDDGGSVTCTVSPSGTLTGCTLPGSDTPGDHVVTITLPDGSEVETTYNTPEPPPSVTVPGTILPGDDLTISGENLPPGGTVTIDITDKDGNTVGTETCTVASDGTLSNCTVSIPPDLPPGDYTVTTTLPDGTTSESTVTVPVPGITVDEKNPNDDGSLPLTGSNLPPNTTVTITDEDGNVIGTLTTDDKGNATGTIPVPDGSQPGTITVTINGPDGNPLVDENGNDLTVTYTLVADIAVVMAPKDKTYTSGDTAVFTITVSNKGNLTVPGITATVTIPPQYQNYSSSPGVAFTGPLGAATTTSTDLVLDVGTLAPTHGMTFTITGTIVGKPGDVVTFPGVHAEDMNDTVGANDNAQVIMRIAIPTPTPTPTPTKGSGSGSGNNSGNNSGNSGSGNNSGKGGSGKGSGSDGSGSGNSDGNSGGSGSGNNSSKGGSGKNGTGSGSNGSGSGGTGNAKHASHKGTTGSGSVGLPPGSVNKQASGSSSGVTVGPMTVTGTSAIFGIASLASLLAALVLFAVRRRNDQDEQPVPVPVTVRRD
ncbi:MAG: DUF11 domain-containing protein, partial [Cellulomonadaceae bacterium]|nr:DUF11 domain-containing protein [Cellulomonadaceae bacterium]